MTSNSGSPLTSEEAIRAYTRWGSLRAAAGALGVSHTLIRKKLLQANHKLARPGGWNRKE